MPRFIVQKGWWAQVGAKCSTVFNSVWVHKELLMDLGLAQPFGLFLLDMLCTDNQFSFHSWTPYLEEHEVSGSRRDLNRNLFRHLKSL